jgi:hypothetical protein
MSDAERQMKQSFDKLDAAWTAHHVRLAARIDALTGLVLALCQRLGLDRATADRMLTEHEKRLEEGRLLKIEDHNPAIAALSSDFLEAWGKGSSDSSSSSP